MKAILQAFERWYDDLPVQKATGGPARGTIAAALVILEGLKADYNLEFATHRAAGGSQIKGLSKGAVQNILAGFGEARPFLKEGGRTSKGAPGGISAMLHVLETTNLGRYPSEDRKEALKNLQRFLVEKVREYHNRQRIKVDYDSSRSTWQTISDLLSTAREAGKDGPVAQYLVGAKLALRFPNIEIGNESYSTADEQLDRPGDFYVGDTAFHVTVSPMSGGSMSVVEETLPRA